MILPSPSHRLDMNSSPSSTVNTGDALLAPHQRRSSLLTNCPRTNLKTPIINVSHRIQLKAPFPIRDSRSALVAICQQHGNTTFTLFSQRPLSPGQRPSFTMGARILYELGRVNLTDLESGIVQLWNGRMISFQREGSTGAIDLRRLDQLSTPDKACASRFDGMLQYCAAYLLKFASSARSISTRSGEV